MAGAAGQLYLGPRMHCGVGVGSCTSALECIAICCGQLYPGPRMHCDLLWSVVHHPPNVLRFVVVSCTPAPEIIAIFCGQLSPAPSRHSGGGCADVSGPAKRCDVGSTRARRGVIHCVWLITAGPALHRPSDLPASGARGCPGQCMAHGCRCQTSLL